MEKYIYNNNKGLWYELQGDFYISCLTLGETEPQPIGMWGRKYLRYIKEYRPVVYTTQLLSGKLNSHLAEIDNRATEMLDRLMKQLSEREGITENLKAQNPVVWVQQMNRMTIREMDKIIYPVCTLCRDHEKAGFIEGLILFLD